MRFCLPGMSGIRNSEDGSAADLIRLQVQRTFNRQSSLSISPNDLPCSELGVLNQIRSTLMVRRILCVESTSANVLMLAIV